MSADKAHLVPELASRVCCDLAVGFRAFDKKRGVSRIGMTDLTNFTGIRQPRLPPSRASYVGHEQNNPRSSLRRHFITRTIGVTCYFSLLLQFHSSKMANVHGLFSGPKDDDSSDEERESRFVGGISARGGGRCVSMDPSFFLLLDERPNVPHTDLFSFAFFHVSAA
jgi:hypothetical protein